MDRVRRIATPPSGISKRKWCGVVLAALLALSDLVWVAFVPEPVDPSGELPGPDPVTVLVVAMAVVTLAGCAWAWRRGSHAAVRVAAVSRMAVVLLTLPAFFYEGVPPAYVAGAAVTIAVTLGTVALLLSRS
jgi:hypothetical protein